MESKTPCPPKTNILQSAAEIAAVGLLHLLLACIAAYPLILYMDRGLAGTGDSAQNAWNLWWVRLAASQGDLFPFYTHMIYHPQGVSLAYHTLGLLNGWVSAALQNLLGLNLAAAYNLVTLLSFALTGCAAYALARRISGSPRAALCASIIFTFAPIRMSRVLFGNLNLYSTQFIPLVVLFFWELLPHGEKAEASPPASACLRNASLAALCLGLTAWNSLELAFGAALLCGLLLLAYGFTLRTNRDSWIRHLRRLGSSLLVFALLTLACASPVLLPMLRDQASFQDQANTLPQQIANSADLLGFFTPDAHVQPVWVRALPKLASASSKIYASFTGNAQEKTVFIGYSVLILVFSALRWRPGWRTWGWALCAALLGLLCLGPTLHLGGQPRMAHLPYEWLNRLPLVSFGRTPSRLAFPLMLALAVIAAQGLAAFEKRWPRFQWLSLLFCGLVFAEFLAAPLVIDMRIAAIPAIYTRLADGAPAHAILDLPIDLYGGAGPGGEYLLYQTIHQQPIVGGYISRTPSQALWLLQHPFLNELRVRIYGDDAPYRFDPQMLAPAREELQLLQVRYVILHRAFLPAQDFQVIHAALVSVLGAPQFEDDQLSLWDAAP